MINNKHAFWEALIIAVFIFGLGILLGILIENSRTDTLAQMYEKSELDLLDIKIQSEALNLKDVKCEDAIEKNILFGDEIYNDAETLNQYEDSAVFSELIVEQHKKYDLLRTLFWLNSIKIKEKCGNEFHTVVYLYNYLGEKTDEEKDKQYVFSRFLAQLKEKEGSNIILIPIAKDTGLTSLDLLMKTYNITEVSILLDEKYKFTDLENLTSIENYI